MLDRLDQGAALVLVLAPRQRMQPARLGKAPHQRVGGRIQEQHRQRLAALAQLLDLRRHARQRLGAAHVDRDRDPVSPVLALDRDEVCQQFRRQVVDAVEARVLERVQCDLA